MSGQQQRVRRNASPATTGPMKATIPVVALMRPSGGQQSTSATANKKNSPTSSDSPTAAIPRFSDGHKSGASRQSPDQRISPESWKSSAASPISKEKSKPIISKSSTQSTTFSTPHSSTGGASHSGSSSLSSAAPYIRRTGSLDTLYLAATGTSSWPAAATASVVSSCSSSGSKDSSHLALYGGYCGRLMVDRATQTPEEWEELDRKKGQQRKASELGPYEMKFIRTRLQRSTQLSRGSPSGGSSSSGQQQPQSGASPAPSPIAAPPSQIFSPVQGGASSSSSTNHSTSIISAVAPLGGGGGGGAPSSSPSMYQQPLHFLPGAGAGHSSSGGGPPLLAAASASQQQQQQYVVSNNGSYQTAAATTYASLHQSAAPIPIPHIPKPLIPRMRSSVEGLNQEIEKLVLRGISGNDAEGEAERVREPTPDGHRAPIAKLFRTSNAKGGGMSSHATSSVDTQTASTGVVVVSSISGGGGGGGDGVERSSRQQLSGSVTRVCSVGAPDVFLGMSSSCVGDGGSGGSSAATSRSQSVSPTGPLIPGSMDNSRPPSSDGRKSASPEDSDPSEDCKFGASPRINKFLAREPPDGCEKIKLVEEPNQMCPLVVEPCIGRGSALICGGLSGTGNIVLRPSVNFVLMPSQSSAFHPLYKPYLPPSSGASSGSPSSAASATFDGSSTNFLGVNRGSAPTPPTSRSPLNERLQ